MRASDAAMEMEMQDPPGKASDESMQATRSSRHDPGVGVGRLRFAVDGEDAEPQGRRPGG